MFRLFYLLVLLAFCSSHSFVQAQILVDESWEPPKSQTFSRASENLSSDLKAIKKVGVGSTLAGATGLLGVNIHVNFSKDFTFVIGAGQSRGFQAFNMHFKSIFGGRSFQPYFSGGYSRWFASQDGERVDRTSPPLVKKKFLSSKEINSGNFSEHIIYPGLGVEFINLDGDWRGLSFFAEALLLIDIDDLQTGATAGLGTVYYF